MHALCPILPFFPAHWSLSCCITVLCFGNKEVNVLEELPTEDVPSLITSEEGTVEGRIAGLSIGSHPSGGGHQPFKVDELGEALFEEVEEEVVMHRKRAGRGSLYQQTVTACHTATIASCSVVTASNQTDLCSQCSYS